MKNLRIRSPLTSMAATVAVLTATTLTTLAADGRWNITGAGSWTNTANWVSGTIADGVGATAYFTNNNGGDNIITLDANRTVGHLWLADNNTGNDDRIFQSGSGSNVLTMQVSSGMPTLRMSRTNNTDAFRVDLAVNIVGTQGLMLVGDGDSGRTASGLFRFWAVPKTYSGDTVLTNGALLQLDNALPDGGGIPDGPGNGDLYLWNGPGTGGGASISELRLQQVNEVVNGLWGNGQLRKDNVAVTTFTVGNNDASSTFSGTLSDNSNIDPGNGPFNLRKVGTGTFTFNGSAAGTAYRGALVADGGTLVIGSSAAIPLDCTVAAGAGILDVSAYTTPGYSFTYGGNGAIVGAITMNGNTINPGLGTTPGALILSNSLTYAGIATNAFDLAAVTTEGAGINDLLIVNGNLDLGGQTIYVRMNFLEVVPDTNSYYTIIRYTGALLNGDVTNNFVANVPAFVTTTFDASVANEIRVRFAYTLSNRDLAWNALGGYGIWDDGSSPNWLDGLGAVTFTAADRTYFTNETTMSASNFVDLAQVIFPGGVTVAGTNDYVFGGGGYLVGGMNLSKSGAGTLVISNANKYTGTTLIRGGTVRVHNNAALGQTSGPTIVTNGGTLDMMAVPGLEPIIVSGDGVGGLGALYRSGDAAVDALRSVTLAGDTTFGTAVDRWDVNTEADSDLGLRGNGFKLTKVGPGQISIVGTSSATNLWDSGLGDIEVKEGTLMFSRRMTMGQANKSVLVYSNATLSIYSTAETNTLGQTNVLMKNVFLTNATLSCLGDVATAPVIFGGAIQVNGDCILTCGTDNGAALTGAISGPGSVRKTGTEALTLTAQNPFTGALIVDQNRLYLANAGGQCLASTNIIVTATNGAADLLLLADEQINDAAVLTLTNAVSGDIRFALKDRNETVAGIQGGAGSGANLPYVQTAIANDGDDNMTSTVTLNVRSGETYNFGGNVRDGGAVTNSPLTVVKTGSGTQIFSGAASHSGTTTISNGLLVVSGTNSVLANSAVNLQGGVLEISGTGAGTRTNVNMAGVGTFVKDGVGKVTLAAGTLNTFTGATTIKNGQIQVDGSLGSGLGTVIVQGGTLSGTGTITDPVTVQAGGGLAPGGSAGALTIGSLTLQGGSTTTMELQKFNATIETPDQIVGLTSLSYGGSLVVVDITTSWPIGSGDEFQLFSSTSYSGNFTNYVLPTLPGGLGWSNSVASDGYLRVIQTVSTTPTNIAWTASGGNLQLSWPESHRGWMAQSNAVNVADTNYWFDISGSTSETNLSVTPNLALTNVFYRLRLP